MCTCLLRFVWWGRCGVPLENLHLENLGPDGPFSGFAFPPADESMAIDSEPLPGTSFCEIKLSSR